MTEKPAEGVRGFFLYSPVTKQHFFRVYDNSDPTKDTFTDYKVCAEDIEVTLECSSLSLYEGDEDKNRLDWSSRVLGRDGKDHLDVRNSKKEKQ